MINATIIQQPAHYELPNNSFAFYYNSGSNELVLPPFESPSTCISPHTLVVTTTLEEAWAYIKENNINVPEWFQQ